MHRRDYHAEHRSSSFVTLSPKNRFTTRRRCRQANPKHTLKSTSYYPCRDKNTPKYLLQLLQHQSDLAISGYLIAFSIYQSVSGVRSRVSLLQYSYIIYGIDQLVADVTREFTLTSPHETKEINIAEYDLWAAINLKIIRLVHV